MQILKSRRRYVGISSLTMTLALLLCCIPTASVKAQKTPPILGGKESSAFYQDVKQLQIDAAANTEAGRLARNRLIAIGVEQIDTAFHDYRKKSRKRSNLLSFLFDFLEIGASSAISIVNGPTLPSMEGGDRRTIETVELAPFTAKVTRKAERGRRRPPNRQP